MCALEQRKDPRANSGVQCLRRSRSHQKQGGVWRSNPPCNVTFVSIFSIPRAAILEIRTLTQHPQKNEQHIADNNLLNYRQAGPNTKYTTLSMCCTARGVSTSSSPPPWLCSFCWNKRQSDSCSAYMDRSRSIWRVGSFMRSIRYLETDGHDAVPAKRQKASASLKLLFFTQAGGAVDQEVGGQQWGTDTAVARVFLHGDHVVDLIPTAKCALKDPCCDPRLPFWRGRAQGWLERGTAVHSPSFRRQDFDFQGSRLRVYS